MEKKKPAQVFHFDLYGKRNDKYDFLNENTITTIAWNKLQPQEPELFFVPKDFEVQDVYNKGFSVVELFPLNNVGIVTAKDAILINDKKDELILNVEKFYNIDANKDLIKKISYRPFDDKFVYYDTKIVERAREKVMQHFLIGKNIGLISNKQIRTSHIFHHWVTKTLTDLHITETANANPYIFPLYLYPETSGQTSLLETVVRTPNLNMAIVNQIAEKLGIPFVAEAPSPLERAGGEAFAPIDILDYIYAVLHSPSYREKYKEFLKIDFPRVPYPQDTKTFWKLVALGSQLRQIHLLESEVVEQYITQYPNDGNNIVGKIHFENNKVYINYDKSSPLGIEGLQYFANVPEVAWNFYIGGYQPAQKWLKDRKDRELNYEDILHYQKMIVALTETNKIMKEIDTIEI